MCRTRAVVLAALVTCACGSGSSERPATPTAPTPSAPTVVALVLSSPALFTGVAQTVQIVATAQMSDSTEQVVTSEATWQSSSAEVATVSTGVVRAIAPGVAKITATFRERSAALEVVVPLIGGRQRTVRVLYVAPPGRDFQAHYRRALQEAFLNLQTWYREQMGGQVFGLQTLNVEECRLPHEEDYYLVSAFNKVHADTQHCGVPSPPFPFLNTWVLYVDLVTGCNDPTGGLGRGRQGLAILPRGDLQGLSREPVTSPCGPEPNYPLSRHLGASAHELGHALGLLHPPGCDQGLATCDRSALMFSGWSLYPNTYLTEDDKQQLRGSPYFTPNAMTTWDERGLPR